MDAEEYKYALGFVFDESVQKVLLVHKQKPDWQQGKVNGVGGKYESGEVREMCICRETKEETTLDIAKQDWVFVGTIRQSQGNVSIWTARYIGALTDARKDDQEDIEWFDFNALPENAIDNLQWLIPLCRQKLQGTNNTFSRFVAEY